MSRLLNKLKLKVERLLVQTRFSFVFKITRTVMDQTLKDVQF